MAFTLGIDFGTNSVRALVVRCADGREAGQRRRGVPERPPGRPARSARPPARPPISGRLPVRSRAERPARPAQGGRDPGVFRPARGGNRGRHDGLEPDPGRPGATARWPWTGGGGAISRPSAGCGRTTPPGARRPGSPRWRRGGGRATSPSAATPIPRSGSGRRSGTAWRRPRTSSRRPIPGSNWRIGSPRSSPGVAEPEKIVRGICAAGHKAMYSDEWGGLPDKAFLAAARPAPGGVARPALRAGLRRRGAGRAPRARHGLRGSGLPAGIPIAIGEFDVHYGAIGCGIEEGTLVKVIGTSTCDCAVVSSAQEGGGHPGHLRDRARGRSCPASAGSRPASRRSATSSAGGSRRSAAATPGCTPGSHGRRPGRNRGAAGSWRSIGTTETARSSSIRASRASWWAARFARPPPKSIAP